MTAKNPIPKSDEISGGINPATKPGNTLRPPTPRPTKPKKPK